MTRRTRTALIVGPLLLVAAIDFVSYLQPAKHIPNTAPGCGFESDSGALRLAHFGQPKKPSAFTIPAHSGTTEDWLFTAVLQHPDPLGPPPKLPGNTTIVLSGGSGVYAVGGWVGDYSETSIPYWPLLLVACIAPLAAIGLAINHAPVRRHPVGTCRNCSYDLRGNITGICPQCGTRCR